MGGEGIDVVRIISFVLRAFLRVLNEAVARLSCLGVSGIRAWRIDGGTMQTMRAEFSISDDTRRTCAYDEAAGRFNKIASLNSRHGCCFPFFFPPSCAISFIDLKIEPLELERESRLRRSVNVARSTEAEDYTGEWYPFLLGKGNEFER